MSWAAKCPRQHFDSNMPTAICLWQRQTNFGGNLFWAAKWNPPYFLSLSSQ